MKTVAVCVLVCLQAIALLALVSMARDSAEETRLLWERVALLENHVKALKELEARSTQLCEVKLEMGRVCRAALRDLVQRLGLDKQPKSAARTVLEAFDGLGGRSNGRE